MGQLSGPGVDPGVVRVVLLNPLNQNENVQTRAVSDENLCGHILLTNTICYLLKNNCDEKKKRLTEENPFLVLNALLIPFLKKIKSDV